MNITPILAGAKKAGKATIEVVKNVNWDRIGAVCGAISATIAAANGVKELVRKPVTTANPTTTSETAADAPEENTATPAEDDSSKEQ